MQHAESTFTGAGDSRLYYQCWSPNGEPRAVLVVVHGLAEHSGRYGNLVNHFVPLGHSVWALDLRGHGRSAGRYGYVERFRHYLDDVATFLDLVRRQQPEKPLFLVGHSMGGTIATACAVTEQTRLDGLILSGALLKPGSSISALAITAARILSRTAPKLGVSIIDSSGLSHDHSVISAYIDDPLVYCGRISARLGRELLVAIRSLPETMPELRLPVLIMHGGDDRLSEPDGSRLLYQRVSSADKTLLIYDGLYHEIFNEPEREQVFEDMAGWLDAHAPAALSQGQ